MEFNALVISINNEDTKEMSPLQKQYHEHLQL
jgi:hypothetical protein